MNIGIIGLGLIGGSIGIALKEKHHVLGFDANSKHNDEALKLGLIHELATSAKMAETCDVVFVATPTKVCSPIINELLTQIKGECTVIDMGSTKSEICNAVNYHPKRKQFVAAHPIAGTENSGPEAAIPDLFKNKKMVICNKDQSSNESLSNAISLFSQLQSDIVFMEAKEHDKHLAYISHLSHICSYALALTVLDIEKDEENIFNLAGSGFSSTARLAKSSPKMWESISMQNKNHLIPAIDEYIKHLEKLKENIRNDNTDAVLQQMEKANEIRRIINQ